MNQTVFGLTTMGKTCFLTRKIEISAMHELRNEALSQEENLRIYGKCYLTHGHDYGVEVCVEGVIDPKSGLICDRDFFDVALSKFKTRFDKTHLNDAFKSTTGENVVKAFFDILAKDLKPLKVVQVRLQETPKNSFTFGPKAI